MRNDKLCTIKTLQRSDKLGNEKYMIKSGKLELERVVKLSKLSNINYGFHLTDTQPVSISSIENDSPAETFGLIPGEIIVEINKEIVTQKSFDDIVQIIETCSEEINLGLASNLKSYEECLCSGFLNLKFCTFASTWRKMWCVIRFDGFFYYYKNIEDVDNVSPQGALCCKNIKVIKVTPLEYILKCILDDSKVLSLQFEHEKESKEWSKVIISISNKNMPPPIWPHTSCHNVLFPALSIKNPECFGFLLKLGNSVKTWKKRYCILKNACLYYYVDQMSIYAKGLVHLHGYKVYETSNDKTNSFDLKEPNYSLRTYHFICDNETDIKRWTESLKKSIGNWIKIE